MDWFKAKTGTASYAGHEDPGVLSVTSIYKYYKTFGYKTIVMGASFRNIDEITSLAGCDRLTIAPSLLEKLSNNYDPIERQLFPTSSVLPEGSAKLDVSEANFRFVLNQDAMATEKLAEGIRGFVADIIKLEKIIADKISR